MNMIDTSNPFNFPLLLSGFWKTFISFWPILTQISSISCTRLSFFLSKFFPSSWYFGKFFLSTRFIVIYQNSPKLLRIYIDNHLKHLSKNTAVCNTKWLCMRDSWKTQSLIFILYTHTRVHTHIHTDREKWLGG